MNRASCGIQSGCAKPIKRPVSIVRAAHRILDPPKVTTPRVLASSMPSDGSDPFSNFTRTAEFWRRATSIYLSYKGAQLQAFVASTLGGKTSQELEAEVWLPQHERAGDAMYDLCITLRGFYLKAGQFIGSRGDFVPEPICKRLCLLCDKVPPMSAAAAGEAVRRELGLQDLSQVFDWIDLDKPLGSASIAQVHKAKLRSFTPQEVKACAAHRALPPAKHVLQEGQTAWSICNLYGISLKELAALNKGRSLDALKPGQEVQVPPAVALDEHGHVEEGGRSSSARGVSAVAAVLQSQASGTAPQDGLVAVKIQYPNALNSMTVDLANLRAAAFYLSKTELKFDLVSAIDELNKQIRLEFDFVREARVMDSINHHLEDVSDKIQVPRSIPGLVSKRLLVMHYLSGIPLLEAGERIRELSLIKQEQGKMRIIERVSEAYGRMILGEGLFQADGHPGNILVSQGGRIGLLDYGQSKQLTAHHRLSLAKLIVELDRGDPAAISAALGELGVVTEKNSVPIRTEMAYGMFDTRGKVDPFDPNSPIKQSAITTFPPDMFFVLRVVQLLRGMANGMGIKDFSSAHQWAPLARRALKHGDQADEDLLHGGGGPGRTRRLLSRVLKLALWPVPQLVERLDKADGKRD